MRLHLGVSTVLAAAIALGVLGSLACGPRDGVGPSEGVLVARIGMALDELRQRSSLPLAEGVRSELTGDTTLVGSPVFDFEVADTKMRFERCRYYFIVTGTDGDSHVAAMSVGISPETMTRAELVAAHQRVQRRLRDDGWRAGYYAFETPEEQALHGGLTESGRGYFWLKGDTLLQLAGKRMDDEQPGEDVEDGGRLDPAARAAPAELLRGPHLRALTPSNPRDDSAHRRFHDGGAFVFEHAGPGSRRREQLRRQASGLRARRQTTELQRELHIEPKPASARSNLARKVLGGARGGNDQMRAPTMEAVTGWENDVPEVTLWELVWAVSEVADDEREVVATVAHMLTSGSVRVVGDHRDRNIRFAS